MVAETICHVFCHIGYRLGFDLPCIRGLVGQRVDFTRSPNHTCAASDCAGNILPAMSLASSHNQRRFANYSVLAYNGPSTWHSGKTGSRSQS